MLHAGVPRLLAAGVALPGLHEPLGGSDRVALEAYPSLLARSVLGPRSYKSDERARQTPERLIARKDLLHALEAGTAPLLAAAGLRLHLSPAQHEALVDDPAAMPWTPCCVWCKRLGAACSTRPVTPAGVCRRSIPWKDGSSRRG